MTTRERDDEWFRKALFPELDPQDAHQDLVRFRRFDARSLEACRTLRCVPEGDPRPDALRQA